MIDKTINLNYFKTIDSENKAYFLGFIAADGAIVNNKGTNTNVLTITLNEKDREVLEVFVSELNSNKPIYNINRKDGYKHVRFTTAKKEFVSNLFQYGIGYRKSLTMGNIIQHIPNEYKAAFIIGYFDGDGCFTDSFCVSPRKYTCKNNTITTHMHNHWVSCISLKGTKEFLQSIVDYLDCSYTLKQINGQNIHTLRLTSNDAILKFYKLYFKCDFYLKRKKSKFTRKLLQVQTMSST